LRTLVKEGGKQIPDDHQRMLVNILDLEQASVDDVMIPRQDIVGIDLDDDWEDILTQLTQTVYTRMPVYRETIDQVEGLLHIRTVIAKLALGGPC
jgi:Mg2+/Co2+ transporter CorB